MNHADMQWDYETDLLVAGSGGGGMMAALCARDQGLTALVLEKSSYFGGTTAMSGGAIWIPNNHHMSAVGVQDTPADALRYLVAVTQGKIEEAKLAAYVEAAPAMVRFLEAHSPLRFAAIARYADYYPNVAGSRPGGRSLEPEPLHGRILHGELSRLRPPHRQEMIFGKICVTAREARRLLQTGLAGKALAVWRLLAYYGNLLARLRYPRDTRLTMGNALAGGLRAALAERDVPVWYESNMVDLIVHEGRVCGVRAMCAGREMTIGARRGVVLATGGFAHNAALRVAHQPGPITTEWTAANPDTEMGDGILAGRSAGGALGLMAEAWWTPVTRVPGEDVPFLIVVEKSLPGCLIVDAHGKRFTNEAAPYVDVVKDMYRSGSIPAFLIMDARYRRNYPCGPLLPMALQPRFLWNKNYRSRWIAEASTPHGLAAKLGIDAAGLEQTLVTFNTNADTGSDPEFHKGDNAYDRYYGDDSVKPNPCLAPLNEAPFFGIRLFPGDLGTKGGLVTNCNAQVLNESGEVIAGLYAVGNNSASVMGTTYPGAGGTIGPAMTFGYLAALHAAAN